MCVCVNLSQFELPMCATEHSHTLKQTKERDCNSIYGNVTVYVSITATETKPHVSFTVKQMLRLFLILPCLSLSLPRHLLSKRTTSIKN